MLTLKFKIRHNFIKEFLEYQRQYTILFHSAFKFIENDLASGHSLFDYKYKDSAVMQKLKTLKNVEALDSLFVQCAIDEAYQLAKSFKTTLKSYEDKLKRRNTLEQKHKKTKSEVFELKRLQKLKTPKVVFGGRNTFIARNNKLISNEELKYKRLKSIMSIGVAASFSNRKFRLREDLNHVLFQLDKKHHYEIELVGVSKGYKDILRRLYARQELKDLPITYRLNSEFIYISFDEEKLYKDEFNFKKKKDRYMALDLNPNYIGYSIVDWKSSNNWNVVESGVYSFKQINDLYKKEKIASTDKKSIYKNNKRRYEAFEVAKSLIEKCSYYKVENLVIEELNFKDGKNLGTSLNGLCNNQWIRRSFINNLKKRCSLFKINFLEIVSNYSSFVGNIIFRKLDKPDMVLSSIELSRRGYEFRHQYVLKDKPQVKNIVKIDINDNVFKDLFRKSMEEFSVEESFKDVIEAYLHFKRDSKFCYRVSLDKWSSCLRSFKTNKSHLLFLKF